MQAVVVHPGSVREALKSRAAARTLNPAKLHTVLLPSRTLSPEQRIAIYQEMYPLRMRDALANDYPGLEHFLGDRFQVFVVAYTLAHPSMGYTLNRLGDHVPSFLGRQTRLKPRGFLRDLARLELAVTEAFDAPQSPVLEAKALEGLPPDRLSRKRLVCVPSLRLVDLTWNAGDFLDTFRDEKHRRPKPRPKRMLQVVVRRDYSVYRFAVPHPAFLVLSDIKAGRSIAAVAQRALSRRGDRRASADDFSGWFRLWTSEGLFSGTR
jgi:hypothetical protein